MEVNSPGHLPLRRVLSFTFSRSFPHLLPFLVQLIFQLLDGALCASVALSSPVLHELLSPLVLWFGLESPSISMIDSILPYNYSFVSYTTLRHLSGYVGNLQIAFTSDLPLDMSSAAPRDRTVPRPTSATRVILHSYCESSRMPYKRNSKESRKRRNNSRAALHNILLGLHNLQLQEPIHVPVVAINEPLLVAIIEPLQPEPTIDEAIDADYSLADEEQLIKEIDQLLEEDPHQGPSPHAAAEVEVNRPSIASEPAVHAAGFTMAEGKDVSTEEIIDEEFLQLTADDADMEFE